MTRVIIIIIIIWILFVVLKRRYGTIRNASDGKLSFEAWKTRCEYNQRIFEDMNIQYIIAPPPPPPDGMCGRTNYNKYLLSPKDPIIIF